MGLFVEAHARRTVQLRDDDALGAVDDERSVLGDQGQIADVHVVRDLLDELALFAFAFEDVEAQGGLEGRGERHAALLAFLDGVLGHSQGIALELKGIHLLDIRDGKDFRENLLKPFVLSLLGERTLLDEAVE